MKSSSSDCASRALKSRATMPVTRHMFRRAPDDGFNAQQHPAECAFPCADADGDLGSCQPSAGFMQAFSSDLSDLMEL